MRVLDPAGAPLAGAQVFARLRGNLVPGANVLTNADGYARLGGLPAQRCAVYAKRVNAPADWLKVSRLVLAEGQEIEMRLRIGLRVSGLVVENGKPVAQAWARLATPNGDTIAQIQTDAEGRFTFLVDPIHEGPFALWGHRFEGAKRFEATIDDFKPGGDPVQLELQPTG